MRRLYAIAAVWASCPPWARPPKKSRSMTAAMTARPHAAQYLRGLAKYIYELEMTDAEERYLDADYVYDWNLALVRIEIPSKVPNIPAKVIAQQELPGHGIVIFGPQEYINTPEQEPWTRNNALRGSNGKMTITHEEEKANENLCLFLRGARPPVHRYRR